MTLTPDEQDHLIRLLRLLRRAMKTDDKALRVEPHLQSCGVCRLDFMCCAEQTKALYDRLNVEILTR